LLLSLILFPIFIPALLAMVQATTAILTGENDPTLDQDAAGLRHHLHHGEFAAVRCGVPRGVGKLI
jgi:ABC-type transport system involved in cytochrome c biogenesis permease component